MQFTKGDYFITPNRSHLEDLDAQSQVVFMWICARANPEGKCFPSFTNLEKTCHLSRPTISNRLKKLEKLGFIKKKVGSFTKANTYQILLLPSKRALLPSKRDLLEVVKEVNSNNNHLTINNNSLKTIREVLEKKGIVRKSKV